MVWPTHLRRLVGGTDTCRVQAVASVASLCRVSGGMLVGGGARGPRLVVAGPWPEDTSVHPTPSPAAEAGLLCRSSLSIVSRLRAGSP